MDFWIIKILMQKTGGRMEKVLNTVLEEQGDFNMPSVRMKMIKSYVKESFCKRFCVRAAAWGDSSRRGV